MIKSGNYRLFRATGIICAIVATLLWWFSLSHFETHDRSQALNNAKAGSTASEKAIQSEFTSRTGGPKTEDALKSWLNTYRSNATEEGLQRGIQIAVNRRTRMELLIEENPGAAIDAMLPYRDYLDLPPEIARLIEQPFSVYGELQLRFECFGKTESASEMQESSYYAVWDKKDRKAFLPDERISAGSQSRMPLTGIELNGKVALNRSPVPLISPDEARCAEELFALSEKKISSDQKQHQNKFTYLLGDRIVSYNAKGKNQYSLPEAVRVAEQRLCPHAVAKVLAMAEEGKLDRKTVDTAMQELDASWTESPKKVLIVRVAFADVDNPQTLDELESIIEWTSNTLFEYSYGKTWLEPDFTGIINLPNPLAHYLNTSNLLDTDIMVDEAQVLLTDLGYHSLDYDIITYQFPEEAQTHYAGWASGSRQYIRGQIAREIYLHEYGHNYGLLHASSWDANDGSVLPSFSDVIPDDVHEEYGDIFDHMGWYKSGPRFHFSAFAKARLNWIHKEKVITLDSVGEYTIRIHRFDHPEALGNPALLVNIEYPNAWPMLISHRRAISDNEFLNQGAYIQWKVQSNFARLIDLTPNSRNGDAEDLIDSALLVGETFTDPSENMFIEILQRGGEDVSSWIDVKIVLGSPDSTIPDLKLEGPAKCRTLASARFSAIIDPAYSGPIQYTWIFDDSAHSESIARIDHAFTVPGMHRTTVIADLGNGNYITRSLDTEVIDPLEPWTIIPADALDAPPTRLKFQDGHFLAFNELSALITGSGSNWTSFRPGIIINDLAMADSIIRCAGISTDSDLNHEGTGQIVTSPDGGTTWQTELLPESVEFIGAVVTGEDFWLAAGPGQKLLRRPPNEDWQVLGVPWNERARLLEYNQGRFYCLTETGKLYESTDTGIQWNQMDEPFGDEPVLHFAGGDKILLAMTENQTHCSINQANWFSSSLFLLNSEITSMACSPDLYFILSQTVFPGDTPLIQNYQATSLDAKQWQVSISLGNELPRMVAMGSNRVAFIQPDGSLRISALFFTGFSNWMAMQQDSPSNFEYDPREDSDKDGLFDIEEYGFGCNPRVSDSGIQFIETKDGSGSAIEFLARSQDARLSYKLLVSEDLGDWHSYPLVFSSERSAWSIDSEILDLISIPHEQPGLWLLSISLNLENAKLFYRLQIHFLDPE